MQSRTVLVVLTMAACTAFALDAACVDITIPPQAIDFNTAFTPQIAVMNNGPEFLFDVPVRFVIVRTSDPTDTIYRDTAHSGAISTYDTKLVNFTLECTPDPDSFTMTGITELSGDVNRHNDTCSKSLFVRYWDVATEIVRPGEHEQPGLVSVQVRLTNMGTVPALVPRVM